MVFIEFGLSEKIFTRSPVEFSEKCVQGDLGGGLAGRQLQFAHFLVDSNGCGVLRTRDVDPKTRYTGTQHGNTACWHNTLRGRVFFRRVFFQQALQFFAKASQRCVC
ncbi:MAG: hypothetical protein SFZ03_02980 [Candidatus Melainabacteria bacterium]|nr:hypothetical protein [Candidatus Melainabacteria bacterium]